MSEWRIVVLHRGHVLVGEYGVDVETDEVVLTSAKTIRRWGTTRGLGELRKGPGWDTVLDPEGEVRAPRGAVIKTICGLDAAVWSGVSDE